MSGKAATLLFCSSVEQNLGYQWRQRTDQRQLDRNEWVFAAQTGKEQTQQHGVQCLCKIQGADPFDVGNDGAAFFHNVFHGRKFGVHQSQCGRPDGRHLLLFAMAIPQSASFRARTSLTPSPYHTYNVIVFLERLYNGVLFFW